MRGVTIEQHRETIEGLDGRLPVIAVRCCSSEGYEMPGEPETVWVRRAINGLVLELEDHDIPDLVKTAYEMEDKASRAEDAEAEVGRLDDELEKAEKRIAELERELAALKGQQAVVV